MTPAQRTNLLTYIETLVDAVPEVRATLDREYGHPCAVHVVVPDPEVDRAPGLNVCLTRTAEVELEELLEETWPAVNFDFTYVDEEDL